MCDLPAVERVAANANSGWEPMLPSSLERGNIVLLGLLSLVAVLPIVAESAQGLVLGYFNSPTRSTSENLGIKRYVTAGDRAYEVGTLDGGFPPTGWHIKGRMNGVWAPPIKLLDSYQFLINGQPLPRANQFTSGAGYIEFEYPNTNGLEITRTVFAPDGIPAVLVGLKLRNASDQTQSFRLSLEAVSELIAAYPWSKTMPTSDQIHQPDWVSFEPISTGLLFGTPESQFYALVSGLPQTSHGRDFANFAGALLPVSPPQSKRAVGELIWQVTLTAENELKLWFTVAGSHTGRNDACLADSAVLQQPDRLLYVKVAEREALLARSKADIPNATLQAAFDWAKLNLAEMRRAITDAQIRDTENGTLKSNIYPPPLATYALLRGFGAGYPDYPWYFGTDGAYTVFALVAVGQFQTAKDHLRLLREVSRRVNGRTAKVLHEIVTDGSVYYGTKNQPGDINETAEFATAVATVWRWTGDNEVRDENYEFISEGLHYLTEDLDLNKDGWPEGDGMVEESGMGAEKLDTAVYTIRALNDLAEMAAAKGDEATQKWATDKACWLLSRFEQDWWMPERELYADSLALNQQVPTNPLAVLSAAPMTKLQQLYWINATPMETDFARGDHANAAFANLESSVFTGTNGFYQAGVGGGFNGKGDLEASALPSSVMAVAEANYGRVDESLRYVLDIARQLDLEQPGALPEQMPSPGYVLFPFQPLIRRAMVMQAWSSYGVLYPLVHYFLGVRPQAPKRLVAVLPQLPSSLPQLSIKDLRIGDKILAVAAQHQDKLYMTEVTLPASYCLEIGHTLPANAAIESVTLNGKAAAYEVRSTHRGNEVFAHVFAAGTYRLVIQTR
jgi:glycogen debranching enzyme